MTSNLFTDLPENLPDELLTTLLKAANIRIERIVSHGHASPDGFWYHQDQHEWVIVLQGAARLPFDDNMMELKPGDFVNIPAHKKHRVEWTTPDGGSFTEQVPPDDSDLTQQIVTLLGRGEKIEAVKLYRDSFRVGLQEAKEAVERIGEQNGIPASSGSGCLGIILLGIVGIVRLLN
jgi:cupin 2 domain-containing protein